MAKLKANEKKVLSHIVEQTKTAGFTHVEMTPELKKLVESGHVEADTANVVDGKIAVRATAAAIEPVVSPSVEVDFQILDGLDVPASQRGNLTEKYPFSKLEVGQSFFVPMEAAKFTSTVSSASRRFAAKTGEMVPSKRKPGAMMEKVEYTRLFVLRAVKAGQKYANGFVEPADGARVFRTK